MNSSEGPQFASGDDRESLLKTTEATNPAAVSSNRWKTILSSVSANLIKERESSGDTITSPEKPSSDDGTGTGTSTGIDHSSGGSPSNDEMLHPGTNEPLDFGELTSQNTNITQTQNFQKQLPQDPLLPVLDLHPRRSTYLASAAISFPFSNVQTNVDRSFGREEGGMWGETLEERKLRRR